jgi:O-antigen ligase
VVGSIFMFVKSKPAVRIAFLLLMPILAIGLIRALPEQTLARLQNISISDTGLNEDGTVDPASTEAQGSAKARRFLLEESIRVTLEHPLFGVGPGQFAAFEGRATGWHSTHNSFTQISSECGIPALIFFLAGIFSAFRLLLRVWKQARYRPDMQEVVTVCYCLSLSFVMFLTVIFFLNFGYFFYLPAFTGLFIALWRVAGQDFPVSTALEPARVPWARPSALKGPSTATPVPAPLSPPQKTFRFNRYRQG